MRNKSYFTDIPNIGDLDLEKVLFEDICPIFFTLISKEQKRYIGVCCELYGEQRWLISPISDSNLIRMLKDEISMRDAFLTQNTEKCIIAHWSKENPTIRYDLVDTCNLPKDDLPLGECLESEDDEIEEYIELLEQSNTDSYTLETYSNKFNFFSIFLTLRIDYKVFERVPDVFQEEKVGDSTYVREYAVKYS